MKVTYNLNFLFSSDQHETNLKYRSIIRISWVYCVSHALKACMTYLLSFWLTWNLLKFSRSRAEMLVIYLALKDSSSAKCLTNVRAKPHLVLV